MSIEVHQALLAQLGDYPQLKRVIEHNGMREITPHRPEELLHYLARAVAGQQLSTTAARTIWSRVETLLKQHQGLPELLVDEHYQALRDCGLSNAKVKTILGVNQALQSGQISPEIFTCQDGEFIRAQLVSLWGIGHWTAEMALMFFFALPNVWSPGDAALMRGLNLIADKEGVSADDILAAASPYHSYLALHIWAMLDAELLKD